MERTPEGTSVGVDDPYEVAGPCDHLTNDGRCRFALDRAGHDPEFAANRRHADYACVAAAEGTEWRDCPHYRSTTSGETCRRCGLEEVRLAHEAARPLLEEHHLSYHDRGTSHEITVTLCRWCHAKVHNSFARIDDDASPDPEAVAAREERRSKEQAELGFESARERYGSGSTTTSAPATDSSESTDSLDER
jgi:ribosomal protein L40E